MMWLWALVGCGSPTYGTGPYLVLRGTVDPGVQVQGNDAVLRALWTIVVDGDLCTDTQPLEILPYVTAFEVPVHGPPDAESPDSCVRAPETLGAGPAAFGLLLLIDPDSDQAPTVTASPLQLLEWFAGDPLSLSELVVVQRGALAGVVSEQVLIVYQGVPSFSGDWCRFDAVLSGMTLYEDGGEGCGGWIPVDAPGVRTEVQGIVLVPPT